MRCFPLMYLLIDHYKGYHEYRLFTDQEVAIREAEKLAAEYPQDWVADYSGNNIIFGKQGEEPSWNVEVLEIKCESA